MWREFFLKSGESRLMEDFRVEADTQLPRVEMKTRLSIQERSKKICLRDFSLGEGTCLCVAILLANALSLRADELGNEGYRMKR